MAALMVDMPQFRAANSSPPPPAAMGAAANGQQAVQTALAPIASAVADGVGRIDNAAQGYFAPAAASAADVSRLAGQGLYSQATGAALRTAAQSVAGAGLTAGTVAAAPFVGAANIGKGVLQGIFGGAAPAITTPAAAAPVALPQPAPAVSLVPAAVPQGADVHKAVAEHLTQQGMAAQGMVPGSTGTGTSPSPTAAHSLFGQLPAFLVPQIVDAAARAKGSNDNPIAGLVDNLHVNAASQEQKIMENLKSGAVTLEQAAALRKSNAETLQRSLMGLAGLAKLGVAPQQPVE